MESPDLETVQKALELVEHAIRERSHASAAVPYFALTNLGGLPPAMQEAELRNKDEIMYGNRVRAGVHMSMASAAASLRACERLMADLTHLEFRDRQKEMLRCAGETQAAKELAEHATAILSGREAPRPDAMTEIKKLKAAIYLRFGQLPRASG